MGCPEGQIVSLFAAVHTFVFSYRWEISSRALRVREGHGYCEVGRWVCMAKVEYN